MSASTSDRLAARLAFLKYCATVADGDDAEAQTLLEQYLAALAELAERRAEQVTGKGRR